MDCNDSKTRQQSNSFCFNQLINTELVKIGMITSESIDTRMKEPYSIDVPVPFDCVYACEVKVCLIYGEAHRE